MSSHHNEHVKGAAKNRAHHHPKRLPIDVQVPVMTEDLQPEAGRPGRCRARVRCLEELSG